MSKLNLAENWIVVSSKSYPDKVYYFNVKTKESSWIVPTPDTSQQTSPKGVTTRKRKKLKRDEETNNYRPTTPETIKEIKEVEDTEKPLTARKKLTAKRLIPQPDNKSKKEIETQQMKDLRELMRKRQEMAAKKGGPKNSKVVVNPPTPPVVVTKTVAKKKCVDSDDTKSQSDNREKTEVLTPQMRAILERMKQKPPRMPAKAKALSVNNIRAADEATKEPVNLGRPRSTRSDCASTVIMSRQDKEDKGKTVLSETIKRRSKKKNKKNLGKERLEKLRNSLSLEEKLESSCASTLSQDTDNNDLDSPPPSIYKNARIRLLSLKQKLSNDNLLSNKDPEEPEVIEKPAESTTEDLVKHAYENSFEEEMDWEPMEDERITIEVQAVRTELCTTIDANVNSNIPSNTLMQPLQPEQREKEQLYIVVDTNVFLSNIQAVEVARNISFRIYDQPIIVIPWTVIRELDYIKDDKAKTRPASLRMKARRAVEYLNKLFSANDPRIIGQTPEDVAKNKELFVTYCPDDEILQTCLQIRNLGKPVVLLSYDKNLCNKGMIHKIVTLGRDDPLEKIDNLDVTSSDNNTSLRAQENFELASLLDQELRVSNQVLEDTKCLLRDTLTVIVTKEMQTLFGENWEKHVIIRPPWSIVTVLKCAVKHWIAAVSDSFMRKAEITLKELLQIFINSDDGSKTLRKVVAIIDKCNDLIQMIDADKHSNLVIRALQKIKELKEKCRGYESRICEKKLQDAIGIETNPAERKLRADKAFRYFEEAYVFSRDMCGLAAEVARMPCSFHYEVPTRLPCADYVKQIQPELAMNLSRLLHTLSAVMEQVEQSFLDYRTLTSLYQVLVTFLPESAPKSRELNAGDLTPLDVECCVKEKKDLLQSGLRQLQELSTHLCRLASFATASN